MMALLTPLQFMALFTDVEQATITGAAMQSPPLMLWLLKLSAADPVDTTTPDVANGLGAMAQAGILSQERVDKVWSDIAAFTPPKPPALTIKSSSSEKGTEFGSGTGRFYFTEFFELSDGSARGPITTLCEKDTDLDALMAIHAANLTAELMAEAA
jgi:hypothetical protein